ncbi:MAG: hypothetical protein ACXVCR_12530, partial [Bdellovibrio sp.]
MKLKEGLQDPSAGISFFLRTNSLMELESITIKISFALRILPAYLKRFYCRFGVSMCQRRLK